MAGSGSDAVRITGLRELRLALRALDRTLPKEITKAGKDAARIVVDTARPRVPRRSGRAASSIRVAATQRGAGVRGGSNRVPYYGWLDFGGTITPRPGQDITRPFLRRGRYIWAAFADKEAEVMDVYLAGVRRAAADAGLETDI